MFRVGKSYTEETTEKGLCQCAKWKAGPAPRNQTVDRERSRRMQMEKLRQLDMQSQHQLLLGPFAICGILGQVTRCCEDYFFICEAEMLIVQTVVLIR